MAETKTIDTFPTYLVINPLHIETQTAPHRFALIKREDWWDGTCVKVAKTRDSGSYWVQAWKKELTLNYKVDERFNNKMQEIRKIVHQLDAIKENLNKPKVQKIMYKNTKINVIN